MFWICLTSDLRFEECGPSEPRFGSYQLPEHLSQRPEMYEIQRSGLIQVINCKSGTVLTLNIKYFVECNSVTFNMFFRAHLKAKVMTEEEEKKEQKKLYLICW